MAKISDIQAALKAKGFDPGAVDGIWGRMTLHAVRKFQTANGLTPDGIVGPLTLAKLFAGNEPQATSTPPPVWYTEAVRLLGVREGPGRIDNPVILDWAEDLDIHFPRDEIPWCGLFVAHCIGATLPDEPLPANPLGARQWMKAGKECAPSLGAILVFWRESPQSFKGHVGFYAGEDDSAYHVLGGNQGDSVSVSRIAKNRLLTNGMRQPITFPTLTGGKVMRPKTGGFSLNEA